MRTTLTTLSVVGLLAAGAGTANARPDLPPGRTDATGHAAAIRAQSLHQEQLAAVAASRPPVSASASAPASVVHVTRLADGGFDWADAGIGAGFAAALLVGAAGVSTVRRHPPVMTRSSH
jgi:hypothetical protein